MTHITLTDAALAHIKQMLEKNSKGVGFRLSIKKTGCSGYAYVPAIIETIQPQDVHMMQDDLNIYIDPAADTFINGLIVDYVQDDNMVGLKQKKLIFINPNEKNRCGCGESFTIE